MNTVLNTFLAFILLLFTSVFSIAIADQPDFSICEGLTGVAKGLCRAGVAVGCDQEASNACEQIEEHYTSKTGNEPPWADRSIYINAESGVKRPLDGKWEFGCGTEDGVDFNEYMVFMGDTFEAWELYYTSTDGTCSAGETITIFETGTVTAFEDITVGWENDQPPLRLADDGFYLSTYPVVTKLIISITTGEEPGDYRLFYYMDDTGDLADPKVQWCIYAPLEEDNGDEEIIDEYPTLLTAEEPRCKLEDY